MLVPPSAVPRELRSGPDTAADELRAALAAVWLTAALGWFAEDSGVTVPAAALPLVLPLVIVVLLSLPAGGPEEAAAERPSSPAGAAGYR